MAYGLEISAANGVKEIFGTRRLTRMIKTLSIAYDFSGDISVPDFDDTLGAITFYPMVVKFAYAVSSRPRLAGNTAYSNCYEFGAAMVQLPTLVWNNTTKLLTITPAPSYSGAHRPDYVVNMIHYK